MTPAEELRAAATMLRDTASRATPGPWSHYGDLGFQVFSEAYNEDVPDGVGDVTNGSSREDDAAWIALMSPAVAEHLFRWLADAAIDMAGAEVVGSKLPDAADPIEYCDEPDSVRAALAFARSILGGSRER